MDAYKLEHNMNKDFQISFSLSPSSSVFPNLMNNIIQSLLQLMSRCRSQWLHLIFLTLHQLGMTMGSQIGARL